MAEQAKSIRVALVLPTEFAHARDVLHGIVATTRERNMYESQHAPLTAGAQRLPWQFRVFRGIYTSSRFLGRWFRDWNPDGIICQIQKDAMAQFYRDTGKPVVEVFERNGPAEFPRVLPDDRAAGRLAAEHFLQRGFRHFGFFGDGSMAWVRERESGFREEIERESVARTAANGEPWTGSISSFESEGRAAAMALGQKSHRRQSAAMAEWLVSLPKPLAVFAANDLWGFELVQAARETGLHVPDDVAILGVDNDELLCEISHPALSSIRIGGEQMGHQAVALLEQLLRKEGEEGPA